MICSTCGYWVATINDQCEACAQDCHFPPPPVTYLGTERFGQIIIERET